MEGARRKYRSRSNEQGGKRKGGRDDEEGDRGRDEKDGVRATRRDGTVNRWKGGMSEDEQMEEEGGERGTKREGRGREGGSREEGRDPGREE